jgi:hypothetical protein
MFTQYANPGTATRRIGAISSRDGSHLLPLAIIVIWFEIPTALFRLPSAEQRFLNPEDDAVSGFTRL